jgi:Kunitz/Bovine pancreatic trypsin inhibitor domain
MSKRMRFFVGFLAVLLSAPNAFADRAPVDVPTTGVTVSGNDDLRNGMLVAMPQGLPQALTAGRIGGADRGLLSPTLVEDKAICRQKPERGPCKGLFESYYFDPVSQSCKMFIWGGCQGSVPFRTLDECQKACTAPLPKPPSK